MAVMVNEALPPEATVCAVDGEIEPPAPALAVIVYVDPVPTVTLVEPPGTAAVESEEVAPGVGLSDVVGPGPHPGTVARRTKTASATRTSP